MYSHLLDYVSSPWPVSNLVRLTVLKQSFLPTSHQTRKVFLLRLYERHVSDFESMSKVHLQMKRSVQKYYMRKNLLPYMDSCDCYDCKDTLLSEHKQETSENIWRLVWLIFVIFLWQHPPILANKSEGLHYLSKHCIHPQWRNTTSPAPHPKRNELACFQTAVFGVSVPYGKILFSAKVQINIAIFFIFSIKLWNIVWCRQIVKLMACHFILTGKCNHHQSPCSALSSIAMHHSEGTHRR